MNLRPPVLPEDPYNQELIAHVHPPEYVNPTPEGVYNLVVIGGGTAGLVTATGAAALGARVALVEKHLLGGSCLNTGCVPSKALIRAARAAACVRDAEQFGVRAGDYKVDFGAVMERMRRLRASIAPAFGIVTLMEKGIDVFIGEASFADSRRVLVDGQTLEFARAVIAAGTRPAVPAASGTEEIEFLTDENIFQLTELPARLAVIGGGQTALETAQAFARLGSSVTLYDISDRFMVFEDEDAAAIIRKLMERDGVRFRLGIRDMRFEKHAGETVLHATQNSRIFSDTFDKVFADGERTPNVAGLNLEAVGVDYDRNGIRIHDTLRTTNPRIFAAGDIASGYRSAHADDAMARIVIANALFFGRQKVSSLVIPQSTYTDPEIAHAGVHQEEADDRGLRTIRMPLQRVERAVLDGEDNGLFKVHHNDKGSILGATIVSAHAGELIGEIVAAMNHNIKLGSLAGDIHPYLTQAEMIRKAGDIYRQTLLTPAVAKLLARITAWRR